MADEQERLKIAVRLTRRSIALLESIRHAAGADYLRAAVEDVLHANPRLRGQEMSPEDACLAAGIPLSGELVTPLEETAPPVGFEMPPSQRAWPALVWPVAR